MNNTTVYLETHISSYKPSIDCEIHFTGQDSKKHDPLEYLPIEGERYEEEVNNFIEKVLKPNQWEVVRWTRLPYLCEGGIKQAYYWLDDAVFVIRPKIS
jgi:hypothetical protein